MIGTLAFDLVIVTGKTTTTTTATTKHLFLNPNHRLYNA